MCMHLIISLLNLYQILIRKRPQSLSVQIPLCGKFANGFSDSFLRKEAKRLLCNKPADFHKFRDGIIIFSEEEETLGKRPVSPSHTNAINDELLKIIEAQQKQIDSLTGLIRYRGINNGTSETRNSNRLPPVCYECGKVGHI